MCWLINFITQLITFAVNYMGEPFNTSITTNRGLWGVVRFGSLAYVILVLDLVPGFASGIALVRPGPQSRDWCGSLPDRLPCCLVQCVLEENPRLDPVPVSGMVLGLQAS